MKCGQGQMEDCGEAGTWNQVYLSKTHVLFIVLIVYIHKFSLFH